MKNKISQAKKQKQKLRMRVFLVLTIISMTVLIIGSLLVIFNFNNQSKMRAAGTSDQGGGGTIGNGEILCEFSWDTGDALTATLGPDAVTSGKSVHSMAGGKNSKYGLSSGGK